MLKHLALSLQIFCSLISYTIQNSFEYCHILLHTISYLICGQQQLCLLLFSPHTYHFIVAIKRACSALLSSSGEVCNMQPAFKYQLQLSTRYMLMKLSQKPQLPEHTNHSMLITLVEAAFCGI